MLKHWIFFVLCVLGHAVYQRLSMRVVLHCAGSFFWTGFFKRLLEEDFLQGRPKVDSMVTYHQMEAWEHCSRIFQEDVLLQWNLEHGILGDLDGDFFFFEVGIACMAHNGEYEQAITYMNRLRPVYANQENKRTDMLRLLNTSKRMVGLRAEQIEIALAFLEDQKFADVSDPLVYIRYGRIFLILLFLIYTAGMPFFLGVGSMLELLYCLGTASQLPLVIGMIMIFKFGGWKRRTLLVLILTLLQKHASYSMQSTPSRIMSGPAPWELGAAQERARQLLLQYPNHHVDVQERASFFFVMQIMFAESMQCRYFTKQKRHCMNAKEAALVTLKMIEVDRLDEVAAAGSVHDFFRLHLDYSGFAPAPFHLHGIEARNRYRANAGIAGSTDSSNENPPSDMVPKNIGGL